MIKFASLPRLILAWLVLGSSAFAQDYAVSSDYKFWYRPGILLPALKAEGYPVDSFRGSPGGAPGNVQVIPRVQQFTGGPQEHKFWDRKNILLHSVSGVAAIADYWSTRRAMSRGHREFNPIARPFAESNAAFAAYKAGTWGSYVGLSYLFHRKGWHKLERLLPVMSITSDGAAVGLNFTKIF